MKKLSFLFVVFLSFSTFAQEYHEIDKVLKKFYYDYTFQVDSTDASSEKYQEMVLLVGNHSSKFSSKNLLYTDSVLYEGRNKDMNKVLSQLMPQMSQLRVHRFCEYKVFKNYPSKEITRFVGALGSKTTLRADENLKFNWDLTQDKDTVILDYNCRYATCNYAGRKYQAWYTMEIPISDGPYKFRGLPGLIVRIADVDSEHVFQLYKVENCKSPQTMLYTHDKKMKDTTAPKFAKAMKAYIADMYRKYGGGASPIQYKSPERESKTLRNIRSWNNYIEKY